MSLTSSLVDKKSTAIDKEQTKKQSLVLTCNYRFKIVIDTKMTKVKESPGVVAWLIAVNRRTKQT